MPYSSTNVNSDRTRNYRSDGKQVDISMKIESRDSKKVMNTLLSELLGKIFKFIFR